MKESAKLEYIIPFDPQDIPGSVISFAAKSPHWPCTAGL